MCRPHLLQYFILKLFGVFFQSLVMTRDQNDALDTSVLLLNAPIVEVVSLDATSPKPAISKNLSMTCVAVSLNPSVVRTYCPGLCSPLPCTRASLRGQVLSTQHPELCHADRSAHIVSCNPHKAAVGGMKIIHSTNEETEA